MEALGVSSCNCEYFRPRVRLAPSSGRGGLRRALFPGGGIASAEQTGFDHLAGVNRRSGEGPLSNRVWAGAPEPCARESSAAGCSPRSLECLDTLACALCSPRHSGPHPGCCARWRSLQGAAVLRVCFLVLSLGRGLSSQHPRPAERVLGPWEEPARVANFVISGYIPCICFPSAEIGLKLIRKY